MHMKSRAIAVSPDSAPGDARKRGHALVRSSDDPVRPSVSVLHGEEGGRIQRMPSPGLI